MDQFGEVASVRGSGWILADLPEFATRSRAEHYTSQLRYPAVAKYRKGANMKSRLVHLNSLVSLVFLAMPAGPVAHAQSARIASYTITDLGTLGGANSFAYSMNHSGIV